MSRRNGPRDPAQLAKLIINIARTEIEDRGGRRRPECLKGEIARAAEFAYCCVTKFGFGQKLRLVAPPGN